MKINGVNSGDILYQNITQSKALNNTISEELNSQAKGMSKGIDNGEYTKGLIGIAEGAANSVGEQLQRIKELALKSSNGILSNGDKSIIQDEINQIKENINMTVNNTKYNGQKLLDGSFVNKNSATDSDGEGVKLSIDSISLSELGIENFNILGEFDLNSIDEAIKTVSGVRSNLGALSNRLDNNITYNKVSRESTLNAQNKLEDSDLTKEIIKSKNNQILEQFKINMQKKEQENEKNKLNIIL